MNFTDDYLLLNDLKITAPEAEPNLLRSVPENGEVPTIVSWYDERPPGGKNLANYSETYVWCAHCRAKTHWMGYLARYSDGSGVLVGNECGKKQYGVEFEKVEREFKLHKNRQAYLRQFSVLEEVVVKIIEELHAAAEAPAVNWFHDLRRTIAYSRGKPLGPVVFAEEAEDDENRSHFPAFSSTLIRVVGSNGGQLYRIEKERDFAAEEAARERLQEELREYDGLTTTAKKRHNELHGRPKREVPKIYKDAIRNIDALQGAELFVFEVKPKATFEDLWQRSKDLYAERFRFATSTRPTSELRETIDAFRTIADTAIETEKVLSAPGRFFTPRNMSNVVECLNSVLAAESKPGKYTSDGRKIMYFDGDRQTWDVENKSYPPIDLSNLIRFREALSSKRSVQTSGAQQTP